MKFKRKDLLYKTNKYIYDFQQYETIRSFGEDIYTSKSNIDEAEMDQINLLENLVEFNDNSRPRTIEGKDKKTDTEESAYTLYGCCELTPNASKSGIFLIKGTQGKVRPSDLATRLKN